MKLKNVLIVVKDIERARQFYHDLFGLEMKKRISEMQQFLAEQQQNITEYDEQLVRRLIEKITVYDERVTVEFKSGTSVDVRR